MKNLSFLILPLFCFLLACGSNTASGPQESLSNSSASSATNEPSDENTAINQSAVNSLPDEYPQNYQDAGLPMWSKASLERANKIENPKGSRYQIILRSSEKIQDINVYYNNELLKQGWELSKTGKTGGNEERRSFTYSKKDQQLMVYILSIPDQDENIISIMYPEFVR